MLKRSLAKVQEVQRAIAARREDVLDQIKILDGDGSNGDDSNRDDSKSISQGVQSLLDIINNSINELDKREKDRNLGIVQTNLDQARLGARKVKNQLAELTKQLGGVADRLDRLRHAGFRDTLDKMFVVTPTAWITALEDIERDLRPPLEPKAGGAPAATKKELWDRYIKIAREDSQPIIEEYVSLLSGIALRDLRVDDGICDIADELIGRCQGKDRDTLHWSPTIPHHQNAVSTKANVVRLGFPGWTIWVLPLAAREFGYHVVLPQLGIDDIVDGQCQAVGLSAMQARNHLRDCLADAFATYAMGPSYPCAAILLRFEPLNADLSTGEQASDAVRAHIVLEMLKLMDEENKEEPNAKLIDTLRSEWNAAFQQANSEKVPDLGVETHELDQWVKEIKNALPNKTLARYIGDRLSSVELKLKEMVEEVQRRSKTDEEREVEPAVKASSAPHGELRDVLAAAWRLRLSNPSLDPDVIADQAKRLLEMMEDDRRQRKQEAAPPKFTRRIG
jgi:hypothetical protein